MYEDITMAWTVEQIEKEWLGGERVTLPSDDVVRAFTAAEQVRGRDWVLNTTSIPGGSRQWGFGPFLRVYAFGKRIESVSGAPGADSLLERLLQGDRAAESELTAIYLLRSRRPETQIEVGPGVRVGDRHRRPDFRIRRGADPWIYVEVTQLNRSTASERTQETLRRIATQLTSVLRSFVLEIVFWRDPTEGEQDDLVRQACDACQEANSGRRDIGDLASLLVKSGDPAVVIPSILPDDDETRMAIAQSIVGPGQPNRQIVVRVPFADQRAEVVLSAEARQLPKNEPGLVMVDVAGQPTAFESWADLVPRRFTPTQRASVACFCL
jgi:hypothetical protein